MEIIQKMDCIYEALVKWTSTWHWLITIQVNSKHEWRKPPLKCQALFYNGSLCVGFTKKEQINF